MCLTFELGQARDPRRPVEGLRIYIVRVRLSIHRVILRTISSFFWRPEELLIITLFWLVRSYGRMEEGQHCSLALFPASRAQLRECSRGIRADGAKQLAAVDRPRVLDYCMFFANVFMYAYGCVPLFISKHSPRQLRTYEVSTLATSLQEVSRALYTGRGCMSRARLLSSIRRALFPTCRRPTLPHVGQIR